MGKIMATSAMLSTMRALLNDQYDKVHKLQEEKKEIERDLEHRDTILSNMYDLVRCDYISYKDIVEIIKAVVDTETGADTTEKQKKLVKMFWHRDFLHISEEDKELLDLDYGTGYTKKFVK